VKRSWFLAGKRDIENIYDKRQGHQTRSDKNLIQNKERGNFCGKTTNVLISHLGKFNLYIVIIILLLHIEVTIS